MDASGLGAVKMALTVMAVLVVGAIDVVAAIGLMVFALALPGRIAAARHWPLIQATVLSSQVRATGRGAYIPVIRYRYAVKGDTHESSLYRFGGWATRTRTEAEAAVAAHPAGGAVEVRYDPDKPSFAVISASGEQRTYLLRSAAFWVGALLFGGFAFVLNAIGAP